MSLRVGVLLLALAWPAGLAAQGAGVPQSFADRLEAAADALDAAGRAGGQVAALTSAVAAFEAAMSTLRDGERRFAAQQDTLSQKLRAAQTDAVTLLGALQQQERTSGALLLVHPAGPLATARASMLLAAVAPSAERQAEVLRRDLADYAEARRRRSMAGAALSRGLGEAQAVRAALSEAIAERTPTPDRSVAAIATVLREQAAALAEVETGLRAADTAEAGTADLPLPAPGRLVRRFGETDAAGIVRPGWVIATSSGVTVSAPAAGTVRHAGPLLDYGNVIVLEPEAGLLVVLAGLSDLYARPGDIVARGARLARMGGGSSQNVDFTAPIDGGGGAPGPETLYIEVRQGGRPVDPAEYFAIE